MIVVKVARTIRLMRYAAESQELQHDYFEGGRGLEKHFSAKQSSR
jgi:hypothetical protein